MHISFQIVLQDENLRYSLETSKEFDAESLIKIVELTTQAARDLQDIIDRQQQLIESK